MIYTEGEFGIFPAKVVRGLSPNKQTILAWLIFHTNNQTGVAFPSINTLCDECGIKSRTTMINTLTQLEKDGYIKKQHRRREGGGYTSNEYEVYIKRTNPSTKKKQGVVQEMDTNYKNDNQKKLEHWSPTFQKCWDAYGRKGNYKQALKCWSELTPEDRLTVENKIPKYVESTPDKKYRKFFQNWINPDTCCFLDDIESKPEVSNDVKGFNI
tara:strand:+ start:850 stop:1485 length:636 start_codon:yes stop_codon:yes gene_type:complete